MTFLPLLPRFLLSSQSVRVCSASSLSCTSVAFPSSAMVPMLGLKVLLKLKVSCSAFFPAPMFMSFCSRSLRLILLLTLMLPLRAPVFSAETFVNVTFTMFMGICVVGTVWGYIIPPC